MILHMISSALAEQMSLNCVFFSLNFCFHAKSLNCCLALLEPNVLVFMAIVFGIFLYLLGFFVPLLICSINEIKNIPRFRKHPKISNALIYLAAFSLIPLAFAFQLCLVLTGLVRAYQ